MYIEQIETLYRNTYEEFNNNEFNEWCHEHFIEYMEEIEIRTKSKEFINELIERQKMFEGHISKLFSQ